MIYRNIKPNHSLQINFLKWNYCIEKNKNNNTVYFLKCDKNKFIHSIINL